MDKPSTTNRDLFKVITTAHLLRMKSADMDTIDLLLPPPSPQENHEAHVSASEADGQKQLEAEERLRTEKDRAEAHLGGWERKSKSSNEALGSGLSTSFSPGILKSDRRLKKAWPKWGFPLRP